MKERYIYIIFASNNKSTLIITSYPIHSIWRTQPIALARRILTQKEQSIITIFDLNRCIETRVNIIDSSEHFRLTAKPVTHLLERKDTCYPKKFDNRFLTQLVNCLKLFPGIVKK